MEGGIFITQRKYAKDMLNKFNMSNCKWSTTPMNMNEKLQMEDGSLAADGSMFRSLVGGLIYLTRTRPDIAFLVGVVSRFMHNPSQHHLGAVKRILKYVAGTTDLGILYKQGSELKLLGVYRQ